MGMECRVRGGEAMAWGDGGGFEMTVLQVVAKIKSNKQSSQIAVYTSVLCFSVPLRS